MQLYLEVKLHFMYKFTYFAPQSKIIINFKTILPIEKTLL